MASISASSRITIQNNDISIQNYALRPIKTTGVVAGVPFSGSDFAVSLEEIKLNKLTGMGIDYRMFWSSKNFYVLGEIGFHVFALYTFW